MSISEINLHSTMDAQVWTKEFMRLFGGKLDQIDEDLMLGWFANAIMVGYDIAMSRQPDLTGIREVYEKYEHLDNVLSDHSMVDDYRGQMLYTFWQAIKGLCKEGP